MKSFENYSKIPIYKTASEEVILKDINRTFPNYVYFNKGKYGYYGQYALYRVLGKFSTQFPTVGYCQGMNYVVGYLLMISGGYEQEVFSFFLCLCQKFNLLEVYSEEMQELHKLLWVFDKLFENAFPNLHEHFMAEEITTDMWVFKWFLSFFTSCLPLKLVTRIWDVIIIKGLKGLFKVSLGILSILEDELLVKDLSGILEHFDELSEWIMTEEVLIKSALRIKLKRKKIEKLMNDYKNEQEIKNLLNREKLLLEVQKKLQSTTADSTSSAIHMITQEITETLDELPPFKTSKVKFTPNQKSENRHRFIDYYKMGRASFIDAGTNDDEGVNVEQFLDELINEKNAGDSFIIQVYQNTR